jgi:nucleotide-binding universal stress UspA family protein
MTIQKIAVGIDLSPESELAAAHAMSLARRDGAQVVLVHVRSTEEMYLGIDERAHLEELRQRLVGQGVEVSHAVVDGFPDAALADAAHELGADLILLGTHGRTGLKRFLLGSVAERTVRLASSSVMVTRGAPTAGHRRIVVGTDYSPLADRAIAQALEVAAPGAHLHVVHAWHVPAAIGYETVFAAGQLQDALADAARERGVELLRRWRAIRSDVELDMETDQAPAQQALIDRAEALGADLIAVGSHGRRGIRRLVLGSVAETVVRHAPCSVLVAR